MIKNTNNNPSLFSNLSDILNKSHPLYQLADKIDWGKFETAFQPLYVRTTYVLSEALFWEQCSFAMNMTVIPYSLP